MQKPTACPCKGGKPFLLISMRATFDMFRKIVEGLDPFESFNIIPLDSDSIHWDMLHPKLQPCLVQFARQYKELFFLYCVPAETFEDIKSNSANRSADEARDLPIIPLMIDNEAGRWVKIGQKQSLTRDVKEYVGFNILKSYRGIADAMLWMPLNSQTVAIAENTSLHGMMRRSVARARFSLHSKGYSHLIYGKDTDKDTDLRSRYEEGILNPGFLTGGLICTLDHILKTKINYMVEGLNR